MFASDIEGSVADADTSRMVLLLSEVEENMLLDSPVNSETITNTKNS